MMRIHRKQRFNVSASRSDPAGAKAGAVGLKVSPCRCQVLGMPPHLNSIRCEGGRNRPKSLDPAGFTAGAVGLKVCHCESAAVLRFSCCFKHGL